MQRLRSAIGPSSPILWHGASFLAALLVFGWLFLRFPVLYDADSYYHLAVARLYLEEGLVDGLAWARFSLMHEGFGDKELLFHLLLVPFVGTVVPEIGGRLALALLNGSIVLFLGILGARAIGRQGILLPWWIYLTAMPFFFRTMRLRPEIPALLLLVAATWAVSRRSDRLLGVVAFVFALSYTAFQALLGLVLLWFLRELRRTRRAPWPLLLYPVLGVGLALIVHPHFPHNLTVWSVQNIGFFLHQGSLPVGAEIEPPLAREVLLQSLGFWFGLALLPWWTERSARPEAGEATGIWAIPAVAFLGLYAYAERFSVYAIAFTALWAVSFLRRDGRRIASGLRLPGAGRIPTPIVLLVTVIATLPYQAATMGRLLADDGPLGAEEERRMFAAAMPEGARVAAPWGPAEHFVFWAPDAEYLNLLDPIFMALPYPREFAVQERIFSGSEPDVPLQVGTVLASDTIAFSRTVSPQRLVDALLADPRIRPLHGGYHFLARVLPDRNEAFLLDWRLADPTDPRPYPRLPPGRGGELEGFVDLRRFGAAPGCLRVETSLRSEGEGRRRWELSPAGTARLRLGQELVFEAPDVGGRLGAGTVIEVDLKAGPHRLEVEGCPGKDGAWGFYLVERAPGV